MTYGHNHTVVLLVGSTAAKEAYDEDDTAHHYEQYGRRTEAPSKEVKVGIELGLYQSSSDDQAQASQLHIYTDRGSLTAGQFITELRMIMFHIT